MFLKRLCLLPLLCLSCLVQADDWVYLDNGIVRLGVHTNSGACIGFFGESRSGRNLLNHWDEGRFVQQSWYGNRDGSLWNKKPWKWNPVQGGSWKGAKSRLLQFHATDTNLFARVIPRHWAAGTLLTNVIMESSIKLDQAVAEIAFRMKYSGQTRHDHTQQEFPAVFVDAALKRLVYYRGDRPWSNGPVHKRIPGWPNQSDQPTEPWAAYVNDNNWGIGLMSPGSTHMTFYRFGGPSGSGGSGCSYFAPIQWHTITPGFDLTYRVYLTIGTVEEIRERFRTRRNLPLPE